RPRRGTPRAARFPAAPTRRIAAPPPCPGSGGSSPGRARAPRSASSPSSVARWPFPLLDAGEPACVLDRALALVLGEDRQLLGLDRSLRVPGEHRLVAAVLARRQVADQVHHAQPLVARRAPRRRQVAPERGAVLGVVEVLRRRIGD